MMPLREAARGVRPSPLSPIVLGVACCVPPALALLGLLSPPDPWLGTPFLLDVAGFALVAGLLVVTALRGASTGEQEPLAVGFALLGACVADFVRDIPLAAGEGAAPDSIFAWHVTSLAGVLLLLAALASFT